MGLHAIDSKPLPAPPSPTLTNPDMVLPTTTTMLDTAEYRQPGRPPSPSYLVAPSRSLGAKRKSRPNLRAPSSPAEAFASSPTVNLDKQLWDDRRLSYAASSILSEDLENMQIPRFATGLDSDTETLDEDDFDIDTPSDLSYGDASKAEQSSVTLMRAELILANAKKRLNMMDQNLRGARDIGAPLTAANLKRATSLTTGPASFSRPRYVTRDPQPRTINQHMRVLSDTGLNSEERRYVSLNASPAPSWSPNPVRTTRSSEMLRLSRAAFSPEPQLETLPEDGAAHQQQRVRSKTSARDLRDQMMNLRGRISTLKERAHEENMRRRSTMNLRETCPLNDADASAGADQRPRLARITRESNVPGAWVSAETIQDGLEEVDDEDDDYSPASGSASTDRTSTPTTATTHHSPEDGASRSVYEDARESSTHLSAQRHEDRADAFDYSKFFLHSATGSFTPTRARAASASSSDSGLTARGPEKPAVPGQFLDSDGEMQPPPTPETPEALRHIEAQVLPRAQHRRGLSAESLATIATFETAKEGQKGHSIAQWLSRSASPASPTSSRPPSRPHPAAQAPQHPHHQPQTYVSIPPSPAAVAVAALLDSQAQDLGSKDKALVFTLVESLKGIVEQLQVGDEKSYANRSLRRRLDEARRVLEGEETED